MVILGIDPGFTGALALYNPDQHTVTIGDMPTTTRRMSGGKLRTELNIPAVLHWLDAHLPPADVVAWVEDPHALPKQGITSAFRFGQVCGAMQAAVLAYHIPLHLVAPATWKKAMGLSADKVGCQHRASQLLPAHAHLWPLKKHDGRAEAALLAWYGAQASRSGPPHPLTERR